MSVAINSVDTPPKESIPSSERRLLMILFGNHFTHVLDFVLVMPLGPQFMRLFGIGPQKFGWIVSSYTFSASVFGFFGAFFLDRLDRRKALLIFYAGFILATLACAFSPIYEVLVLARVLAGAFGGLMGTTVMTIIGDLVPEKRRGTAIGIIMSAFPVASVLGVPFALILATRWSWPVPFLVIVGMSCLIWIFAFRELPSIKEHLSQEAKTITQNIEHVLKILSKPSLVFGLMMSLFLSLGGFSVIPFMSPYMVSNVGLTEAQLPLIYLCGGILTFFTSQWVGRLADRHGKLRVFWIGSLLSLMPILLVTHLPKTHLIVALATTTFFMSMISARFVPGYALLTSCTKPQDRGSFLSLNSSVHNFSSGLAAFIGGSIIVQNTAGQMQNYGIVGYFAAICTLIAIVFAFKI